MTEDELMMESYRKNTSEKYKREIRRIRSSASFRIGLHLTNAIRKPWYLPILPLTFPIFCLTLGLEKIGRRPTAFIKGIDNEPFEPDPRKHSIVLAPTNGVGFGHFTRMYSLACELRKQDPELEIVFFTQMPVLHIPYADNFPTYHLAGRYKHSDMPANVWNMMVEEMLILIFKTHCPKWFIFDGAYPYRGMLNAIKEEETIEKIWVRRGMLKKGSSIPIDSVGHFDLVVHPGDAIVDEDEQLIHDVNSMHIAPITLIDEDEMWSKEQARKRLGVPLNNKLAYVQLGAGKINDIDSEIRIVVDTLLKFDDVHIVLGESMLGDRIKIEMERVHILRDYPNALYFKAFDISIQAGGYNSFHEMRKIQMPTLFLPNLETGMDDQTARCKVADKEGWGITLTERNPTLISSAIDELFNRKLSPIDYKNGSLELTNYILKEENR